MVFGLSRLTDGSIALIGALVHELNNMVSNVIVGLAEWDGELDWDRKERRNAEGQGVSKSIWAQCRSWAFVHFVHVSRGKEIGKRTEDLG